MSCSPISASGAPMARSDGDDRNGYARDDLSCVHTWTLLWALEDLNL
jgi:hypothetical protein